MSIIEDIKKGNILIEDLLDLASSNDFSIAYAVAESEFTDSNILKISALDNDKLIRLAVVNNKNVTKEILELLLKDEDMDVYESVKLKLKERDYEVVL